jgi:multiple sugar transport system substrate-binding protein
MENSVYADLAPFFAWDKSIKLSDYNEAAMNAGMYKGHRYMVPLSFTSMVWVTTQEALDEAGLDIKSGRQDFMPFMDKLREYKENNPEQTILSAENAPGQMLWLFCPWCGIESVDLEEKKVTVDTEQWRALIEAYKDLFYEDDWVNRTLAPQGGVYLLDRETLFEWESNMSGIAILYAALKETQTPVLLNCPSFDGQAIGKPDILACIREGSPNQLNAWRFLKILMSEELQSEKTNYGMSFPILRSAAKTRFTDLFAMKKVDVSEEEIDELIDILYEVDDCRLDPLLYAVLDELLFPYIEEGRSYESCLLTLEDKLTLMLNE